MIIRRQVTRDLDTKTLQIDQFAFIQDLLKSKNIIDCNSISIFIKSSCFIKMSKYNNYKKIEIISYQ